MNRKLAIPIQPSPTLSPQVMTLIAPPKLTEIPAFHLPDIGY